MCDGVSEGIMVALAVGGAIAKGVSSANQGAQQKAINDSNANVLDQNAGDARLRGATAAGQVRMRTSAQIGQEQAQVGASGVAAAGSPLDVISDKRWLSELDAQTVDANGGREADTGEGKADYLRTAGGNAQSAGDIGAAGDVIGGVSQGLQFGSKAGWFKTGVPPPSTSGTVITDNWAGITT